jgi:hypothetical protein
VKTEYKDMIAFNAEVMMLTWSVPADMLTRVVAKTIQFSKFQSGC